MTVALPVTKERKTADVWGALGGELTHHARAQHEAHRRCLVPLRRVGETPPFVMELPSYKWPSPRIVFSRVYDRANDTLIYVSFSRQIQEASAKMAVSTIPLFGTEVTWVNKGRNDHDIHPVEDGGPGPQVGRPAAALGRRSPPTRRRTSAPGPRPACSPADC